jgi:hypothetical protein
MTNDLLKNEVDTNPNPNVKIGFILAYPFQFYVYKNVYKYLFDIAEFIIDTTIHYPFEQPEELIQDLVALLKKNKVNFRIFWHKDRISEERSSEFFSQHKVLVSLWEKGCYMLQCNNDKRKASMSYGAGKDLTMVRLNRKFHDLILAYGNRDHELFSFYTQARIVGNPKFDDWFNGNIDEECLSVQKDGINHLKKTILYLPTHGDLCSIDDLHEELGELSDDYNVLIKLHYYTASEESEREKILRKRNIILLKDGIDLLPLLKISDAVLSDNSSAIFDAILADKPIIVTDFLSREYLDVDHKKACIKKRLKDFALTYSGSIEQTIKKEKKVITIKKPEELRSAIELALEDPPFYREERKKMRDELFSFQDGNCGKRAADAINELLLTKQLPERPVLYHVIEAFEQERDWDKGYQNKIILKKIRNYEEFLFNN